MSFIFAKFRENKKPLAMITLSFTDVATFLMLFSKISESIVVHGPCL